MNSYLQLHTILKASFVFNNHEDPINIDTANTIQVLKNTIGLSKKIKFKDYNLYYHNKIISDEEDTIPIKTIIKHDYTPVFFVIKKNDIVKQIQMEEILSGKYNNKVVIENSPSKSDLLDFFNKFIKACETDKVKDYHINFKSKQVIISFKNKVSLHVS